MDVEVIGTIGLYETQFFQKWLIQVSHLMKAANVKFHYKPLKDHRASEWWLGRYDLPKRRNKFLGRLGVKMSCW
jgi:hypothetical protein